MTKVVPCLHATKVLACARKPRGASGVYCLECGHKIVAQRPGGLVLVDPEARLGKADLETLRSTAAAWGNPALRDPGRPDPWALE